MVGDSHARRLRDQAGTYFSLRNVQMEFRCKGGARLSFLTVPESQEHYDLIIFMIGSNDLGDGISPSSIYAHLKGYANEYLEFAEKVVIMTIFPRSNPSYMLRLAELNNLITRNTSNTIVGWRWSKKFDRHMIQHQDGVHLTDKSYRKACKYIASPVFLFCKPSNKLPKL